MDVTFCNSGLRIDYNEDGFIVRDVEAICRISSTKRPLRIKPARKAFCFRIADEILVFSGDDSFHFDARRKLSMITPERVDFPDGIQSGFTSIILRIPT